MKSVITFLFLFAAVNCIAQRQNIFFVKNDGSYVEARDSADFIRIVSNPDSGSTLYNVTELYKSGKRKLIGKSTLVGSLSLTGQVVEFFENGKRKKTCNYDTLSAGIEYSFFPNGKPYITKKYTGKRDTAGNYIYYIISNADSLGNELVSNSNGRYKGYDDFFKEISEEGDVKDGKKEGEWKGKENQINFSEFYKDNILISGISTNQLGEIKKYTIRETLPQFPGGPDFFSWFLGRYIKYPVEERENNVQGKAITHFNVEVDGSITHVEAFDYPTAAIAKQAADVIASSPKWLPASKFGYAVKYVNYTTPVNFTLGDDSYEGTQPSFPGGSVAFSAYLAGIINHSREDMHGTVFVRFFVEKDGNLSNFKVIKSANKTLDNEAISAIKKSPHWYPGILKKSPARVSVTFPVNF